MDIVEAEAMMETGIPRPRYLDAVKPYIGKKIIKAVIGQRRPSIGDIATMFAGRSISILVHPLSYDEFLTFYGIPDGEASLDRYLRGVYDSVVLKDVVMRHGVRSPALLERIVGFLADNVGSPTSARNIANYLKSRGIDGSPQSVRRPMYSTSSRSIRADRALRL